MITEAVENEGKGKIFRLRVEVRRDAMTLVNTTPDTNYPGWGRNMGWTQASPDLRIVSIYNRVILYGVYPYSHFKCPTVLARIQWQTFNESFFLWLLFE